MCAIRSLHVRAYLFLLVIFQAGSEARQGEAVPSASSMTWLKPTPGTSFLWSLERFIPPNPEGMNELDLSSLELYDVDLFESAPEQIKQYKQQGKKVVCYFSAGSWEDTRDDSDDFDPECYCDKGKSCKMKGWNEWWFDLHSSTCIANVQTVMEKRIELAKFKGCDAVEPDNTDSYTNEVGFGTTIDDQFDYLTFLSDTAHDLGLGIALKNGPDMITKRPKIVNITDFAIVEECSAFDECDKYQPFIDAGKAVIQVEYKRNINCTRPGFFLLKYDSLDLDYRNVEDFCPRSIALKLAAIRHELVIFAFVVSIAVLYFG